jgi:hypothetical protein
MFIAEIKWLQDNQIIQILLSSNCTVVHAVVKSKVKQNPGASIPIEGGRCVMVTSAWTHHIHALYLSVGTSWAGRMVSNKWLDTHLPQSGTLGRVWLIILTCNLWSPNTSLSVNYLGVCLLLPMKPSQREAPCWLWSSRVTFILSARLPPSVCAHTHTHMQTHTPTHRIISTCMHTIKIIKICTAHTHIHE